MTICPPRCGKCWRLWPESREATARRPWGRRERVTLGTTLAVNALVQGRAGTVGLALSAGPGLNPRALPWANMFSVAPGGLDHRAWK